jgi:hypothetical protein
LSRSSQLHFILEYLVATQPREEQQPQGAAVAGLVELPDQYADLLVSEHARARHLMHPLDPDSGELLDQADADRPPEEDPKGAEAAVLGGQRHRLGDEPLEVLRRDLAQQLLAERLVEAFRVVQDGSGRSTLEAAFPRTSAKRSDTRFDRYPCGPQRDSRFSLFRCISQSFHFWQLRSRRS